MSVNTPDRRLSKREFDRVYFRIHDDAVFLTSNAFGADERHKKDFAKYIEVTKGRIMRIVEDIGTHIRMANSIYPLEGHTHELEERRIEQGKAIGLCYDLLTKYQLIMHTLEISDDKFVQEIKHIGHEINCLKRWRTSDNKRFSHVG